MLLGLGHQILKTAGVYLAPIKSYSKKWLWVILFLDGQ
jgi:hypothetical protein